MTNAEKYIKEELINTGGERFIYGFTKWLSDNRVSRIENERINQLLSKFLTSTVKPTLTEDEKVILRNIDKMYSIISRNNYSLYVATPNIHETGGQYAETRIMPFDHLFQFIKPRRRI